MIRKHVSGDAGRNLLRRRFLPGRFRRWRVFIYKAETGLWWRKDSRALRAEVLKASVASPRARCALDDGSGPIGPLPALRSGAFWLNANCRPIDFPAFPALGLSCFLLISELYPQHALHVRNTNTQQERADMIAWKKGGYHYKIGRNR
jgi:hypothetical protein